jgi:putative protease
MKAASVIQSKRRNPMDWTKVGVVTHYFDRIGVAALELTDHLAAGDWIAFVQGEALLFEQEVTSLQIEHQNVVAAEAGYNVGLQVSRKVKAGTEVYKRIQ